MARLIDRTGWVPSGLRLQGSEAFVNWCWLGETRFTDPFFDCTLERAISKPFNTLFAHGTPLAELGEWSKCSPGLDPTGFIFHMSRCGSTLVSQMLAAVPEHVVISEAAPLDKLARAACLNESTRSEWLRWMVSALGQKRCGLETRLFIKFDSASTCAIPALRAAFPDTPWIFLYRDPEEVLVSHLRRPAAAMWPGMMTDVACPDGWESMSAEEYAAYGLGTPCQQAIASYGEGGGLLVNYNELPGAVAESMARHVGVQWNAAEQASMREASRVSAKRPGEIFTPDSSSKRREVSEAARAAAAKWILPHYAELERLRRECRTSSPPVRSKPSSS